MRKLTANQTKKMDAYLAAHREKAEAEARLEAGKADVMAIVQVRGGVVTFGGAKLSIETAASYDYSEAVTKLATKLNALRKEERETGVATKSETPKLVCRDSE